MIIASCISEYDISKLTTELSGVIEKMIDQPWIMKPEKGKYFGWSALPLYSINGEVDIYAVDTHISQKYFHMSKPTPFLSYTPYIQSILEDFPAQKLRVRFMMLKAGGHIGVHSDKSYGWEKSIIRLHVPIITDKNVVFLLDGKLINMEPGELWYLDTTRMHEVHNYGDKDKIHLRKKSLILSHKTFL